MIEAKKAAAAYRIGDAIILHASSRTTAGLWILSTPVLACDAGDTLQLGKGILAALEGSVDGVPHPTSWKGRFDPVLRLAGVRSWRSFARTASCVEIECEKASMKFEPTRNLGPKEGYEPLPGKSHHISLASGDNDYGHDDACADMLGRALLAAFADCE